MSIFKDNDVRGLYPKEWDKDTAEKIGLCVPSVFKMDSVCVGRDGRESSLEIFTAISKALLETGVKVFDIGIVDTPALYFAVGHHDFDGGIMITASHNPKDYNGLKIVGKNCVPISKKNGLDVLAGIVGSEDFDKSKYVVNTHFYDINYIDIQQDYISYLSQFKGEASEKPAVAIDCSNGAAGRFAKEILSTSNFFFINEKIDGSFPNHGPNPTLDKNLVQLQEAIKNNGSDIGFCFDGDGDRVVILNSKGEKVSPDVVTAILGIYYYKYQSNENKNVLVDIRSSIAVTEFLKDLGAKPSVCPVGHSKIKTQMRDEEALFAGELTGHYYFKDNYYSDSTWVTIFQILEVMAREEKTIEQLEKEIIKYFFSGEINFKIEKKDEVIEFLLSHFSDATINDMDGYRFDYPDWWFIVRKSGTEPLLRLVAESKEQELLNEKVAKITSIIEDFEGVRHE